MCNTWVYVGPLNTAARFTVEKNTHEGTSCIGVLVYHQRPGRDTEGMVFLPLTPQPHLLFPVFTPKSSLKTQSQIQRPPSGHE